MDEFLDYSTIRQFIRSTWSAGPLENVSVRTLQTRVVRALVGRTFRPSRCFFEVDGVLSLATRASIAGKN